MQDKIFKVKIFEVTSKSVKFVKVFSLEIFRLYGKTKSASTSRINYSHYSHKLVIFSFIVSTSILVLLWRPFLPRLPGLGSALNLTILTYRPGINFIERYLIHVIEDVTYIYNSA